METRRLFNDAVWRIASYTFLLALSNGLIACGGGSKMNAEESAVSVMAGNAPNGKTSGGIPVPSTNAAASAVPVNMGNAANSKPSDGIPAPSTNAGESAVPANVDNSANSKPSDGIPAPSTNAGESVMPVNVGNATNSTGGMPVNPVASFSCPATGPTYGQRTLRLLTKNEYQRSVRDLVGYQADLLALLPDDYISGSFPNNNSLFIDKSRYTSYLANAERIATDVSTRWNSVLGCTPSDDCAGVLVNTLGPRVFRRPLSSEEKSSYLAIAKGTVGGRSAADGMQVALAAMLSSPQFLYRSEVGELTSNGVYKLTAYEMATYMSYTFTGSTPSVALMATAANGGLDTVAGIRAQATQLLNSENTKVLLGDLANRWLETDKIENLTKTNLGSFSALGTDMKAELGKNFAYAMLDPAATFATLYNPGYTYINNRLAAHYGLPYNGNQDSDGFTKITTADRGGILMSGAFMSRYASTTDSNMITRAVAVRRKLMCQDVPDPPSGVSLDRDAAAAREAVFINDPKTTQRMVFNRITSGLSCSNCHGEIINPLGGTMEGFDTAGRIRTSDLKGNAVDTTGTFFSPYPQLQFMSDPNRVIYSPAITMSGAKDLARIMAEHSVVASQAQTCLATQLMSYSTGVHSIFLIDSKRNVGTTRISKDEENAYRCDIASLKNTLVSNGPRAMLQEIPALNSVMYRQEWAR